jgi:hypothetical protein
MYFPRMIRGCLWFVVLAGAWFIAPAGVRADHIDEQLNKSAPQLIEHLRQQGYKNVGVLRFQVQQGDQKPSFQTGPINGNLVDRLENALILHMGSDETKAIGIIHDAGKEASLRRIADWYGNTADRKKLFDITSYPLAWGDRHVKADAFLTGLVKISSNNRSTTLVIEEFTAAEPAKLAKIAELKFESDIPLLRDLGRSFSIAKRSISGTRNLSSAARRSAAMDAVDDGNSNKPDPNSNKPDPNSNKPDPNNGSNGGIQPDPTGVVMVDGIEFKLLSDNNPVSIQQTSGNAAKAGMQLECPPAEKPLVVSIRNTTDKKLGVDMKINGKSLLFEQSDEAEKCRIWVLDPGKTYLLKGWYLNEESLKNVAPFKILVGDEARQMKESLGQKAGDIDIAVFESTDQPPDADELQVSRGFRGVPNLVAKQARRSFESYQRALLAGSKQKTTKVTRVENGTAVQREIVIADTDEEKRFNQKLTAVDFPNRKPLGSACIKILPAKAAD